MSFEVPQIGELPAGAHDAITDVPGVRVGHTTIANGALQTGVTMVVPHPGNLFQEKVPAAACVLNGFGKTLGLMQLIELGALETPIALTNTFSVGTVATALVRSAVAASPEIGRSMSTVNPVVAECNDGYLNDLAAFPITDAHCDAAIATAAADFGCGAIGAGRGMSCFGMKGPGSNFGHGSGDVVIAFTIADRIPERAVVGLRARHILAEPRLERLFDAAAETTEQAILDALFSAVTVTGRDGHTRRCLLDVAPDWAFLPA